MTPPPGEGEKFSLPHTQRLINPFVAGHLSVPGGLGDPLELVTSSRSLFEDHVSRSHAHQSTDILVLWDHGHTLSERERERERVREREREREKKAWLTEPVAISMNLLRACSTLTFDLVASKTQPSSWRTLTSSSGVFGRASLRERRGRRGESTL